MPLHYPSLSLPWLEGFLSRLPYSVQQSAREIGIRMALGASEGSVVCGFLGRGLRLGAGGAALGLLLALAAARVLSTFLFGVSATLTPLLSRAPSP